MVDIIDTTPEKVCKDNLAVALSDYTTSIARVLNLRGNAIGYRRRIRVKMKTKEPFTPDENDYLLKYHDREIDPANITLLRNDGIDIDNNPYIIAHE